MGECTCPFPPPPPPNGKFNVNRKNWNIRFFTIFTTCALISDYRYNLFRRCRIGEVISLKLISILFLDNPKFDAQVPTTRTLDPKRIRQHRLRTGSGKGWYFCFSSNSIHGSHRLPKPSGKSKSYMFVNEGRISETFRIKLIKRLQVGGFFFLILHRNYIFLWLPYRGLYVTNMLSSNVRYSIWQQWHKSESRSPSNLLRRGIMHSKSSN